VNVPLPGPRYGDVEYQEVWEKVLLPIASRFQPNLVMISAGFDCAKGDPLGGMEVTPDQFGCMTAQLMSPSICPVKTVVVPLSTTTLIFGCVMMGRILEW
jgi:acetoin utilization deacetylase AcuC-like enzyme